MDIKDFFCKAIIKLRYIGAPVPDKWLISALYYRNMGVFPDLKHPKTFSEKMQWLKLHDHDELYHSLVDKLEVKQYVTRLIGEKFVIKTLAVWDSIDNIDISLLPDQFVLKTTNGGGSSGVVICKDKASFNLYEAKEKLKKSIEFDIYKYMGEWVYKDTSSKIIAEEYIRPCPSIEDLPDFKFWCFNGEPEILFYASERFNNEKHPPFFDYYDMDLNRLPIKSRGHSNSPHNLMYFPQFEQMKELARSLSNNIPFVRVDLYLVEDSIYFGELTFYHDSGFVPFEPNDWDLKLGKLLNLDN